MMHVNNLRNYRLYPQEAQHIRGGSSQAADPPFDPTVPEFPDVPPPASSQAADPPFDPTRPEQPDVPPPLSNHS